MALKDDVAEMMDHLKWFYVAVVFTWALAALGVWGAIDSFTLFNSIFAGIMIGCAIAATVLALSIQVVSGVAALALDMRDEAQR